MSYHSIIVALLFFLTGSSRQAISNKISSTIIGVNITNNMPLTHPDGHTVNWTDSFQVYYYDSLTMYRLHYQFDSSLTKFKIDSSSRDADTVLIIPEDENAVFEERRYNYFVFIKDSAYGTDYYPKGGGRGDNRLRVDSVIKKNTSLKPDTYVAFQRNLLTLISQKADKVSGILKETYIPSKRDDPTFPDTCIFSYSEKLKHLPYSLSPPLDSLKNKKLCKIHFIFNAGFNKGYDMNIERRELFIELSEIPVPNEEKLIEFFKTRDKSLLK